MKITISGADGFVGQHLVREAAKQGHSVTAITRASTSSEVLSPFIDELIIADLAVEWPEQEEADAIIHLAGMADVGLSFEKPLEYMATNSAFAVQLGESLLRQHRTTTRVVFVSTGAVYSAKEVSPVSESSQVVASSPYSASKIAYEQLANYYCSRGIDGIIARPFNHIGPGQNPGFIVPDLAQKILSHESTEAIELGNLSTKRDYTDVRDVARAYLELATVAEHKHIVYNIASGMSTSGGEIFRILWNTLKKDTPLPEIVQTTFRPVDTASITGDATRMNKELGWTPQYSLKQSIQDFARGL